MYLSYVLLIMRGCIVSSGILRTQDKHKQTVPTKTKPPERLCSRRLLKALTSSRTRSAMRTASRAGWLATRCNCQTWRRRPALR
jgi:hypothetical protein